MILQELARYYERKAKDSETALAPEDSSLRRFPSFLSSIKMEGWCILRTRAAARAGRNPLARIGFRKA